MSRPTAPLNEVFCRHYQALVAYCRARVRRDLGDPEDFVHLAYLRCSRRWNAARKSDCNEAAYLYQALRWVIIDALRRRARERARPWLSAGPDDGPHWTVLHKLVVREAVTLLKGRQLQVCLALLAGRSDAQICSEMNLSAAALAVHTCRARASLRRLLGISRHASGAADRR